jgi:hypothetical protein
MASNCGSPGPRLTNDWQNRQGGANPRAARGHQDLPDAEQLHLLRGLADISASIRDYEGVKLLQKEIANRPPGDVMVRQSPSPMPLDRRQSSAAQLRKEIATLQKPGDDPAGVRALAAIDDPPDEPRFQEIQMLARKMLAAAPDAGCPFPVGASGRESWRQPRGHTALRSGDRINRGSLSYHEGQLAFQIRTADLKKRFEQLLAISPVVGRFRVRLRAHSLIQRRAIRTVHDCSNPPCGDPVRCKAARLENAPRNASAGS